MKLIKIEQAVIVEGKYDKIKLSSIIDAVIIVTNGFGIFKDKEKLALIRYYADKTGIIIMTDSDTAGFKIRSYLKSCISGDKITNVYIPDIFGKEKRKTKASAEGKLGVEGIDKEIILQALKKAGVRAGEKDKNRIPISHTDLYELGLSGRNNSSQLRKQLLKRLNLPQLLTASAMLEVLNTMMDFSELDEIIQDICKET